MKIAEMRELSPYRLALESLGLSGEDGLEQFVGMAQVAGPELSAYLGIPIGELVPMVNELVGFASQIPQSSLTIIANATYSLGVAINSVPRPNLAPSISLSTSHSRKSKVSLVEQMPPIRHQKGRGTCVAHATLAVYEHYLSIQGAYQDLSEQFLYWNCKRNDGIPGQEGTWLAIALPLLQREGCCLEETWAYNPIPDPTNIGQGPPPGGSQLQALTFRVPSYTQLSSTSVDDIKNELNEGRCVAFSIPVFNSWWGSLRVAHTGDITMPLPNEILTGGHAMCLVGYEDMPDLGLGGGRFILRNSWGTDWGIQSLHGAGYGTIPYAYIAKMGAEAYSMGSI
ncbi:MAG: C1 family peptidase [Microcystaceae cyanobacterium]|nr:C1 family peptidase [Merismopediaceae bacterium]